jgi:hypothetical protein
MRAGFYRIEAVLAGNVRLALLGVRLTMFGVPGCACVGAASV